MHRLIMVLMFVALAGCQAVGNGIEATGRGVGGAVKAVGTGVGKINPFKPCDPCERGETKLNALVVNYERECNGSECAEADPEPSTSDREDAMQTPPASLPSRYLICLEHGAC